MKNTNRFYLVLGILVALSSIWQFQKNENFLGFCAGIVGIGLALKGYRGLKNS